MPEHEGYLSELDTMTAEEADKLFAFLNHEEKIVLLLLSSGKKRTEVARNFGKTVKEVNFYVQSAKSKLGAKNLGETLKKWDAIRSKRTLE